jgi:mono/diheme cytochrome c family protein
MIRRRILIAGLLCLAGCTAKNSAPPGASGDSTKKVDSASPAPAGVPVERALSYEQRQGRDLYTKYCAVCHGKEGKGDGFNAFNLDPRPRDFSDSSYMAALSDDQIVQTIAGGGRSVNKSPLMPSYGWTIDGRQIRYIAGYLRTFSAGQ